MNEVNSIYHLMNEPKSCSKFGRRLNELQVKRKVSLQLHSQNFQIKNFILLTNDNWKNWIFHTLQNCSKNKKCKVVRSQYFLFRKFIWISFWILYFIGHLMNCRCSCFGCVFGRNWYSVLYLYNRPIVSYFYFYLSLIWWFCTAFLFLYDRRQPYISTPYRHRCLGTEHFLSQ